MCPEIKHSHPGQEKSSVLGLEMEALALVPETAFQNYIPGGWQRGLEREGWARAGLWSTVLFSITMTLTDCVRTTHLLPPIDSPIMTHFEMYRTKAVSFCLFFCLCLSSWTNAIDGKYIHFFSWSYFLICTQCPIEKSGQKFPWKIGSLSNEPNLRVHMYDK